MNVESKRTYTADEIKSEVRKTIGQLSELTKTQADFNQFANTVLGKIVALTGSHGALLWQVNGQGSPQITHAIGNRVKELNPDSEQHGNLVKEVIAKETPLGLTSEAVVVAGESKQSIRNSSPFLLLFAPIHNRNKVCCGTIELLQRNDITSSAQDGYLNFLGQIARLFPRWHEQQDLRRLSNKESSWSNKMQFVTEVHRSIELKETYFALANEVRRLLNCDRVSVARWVGSKCKIESISSQDRFENRSNVVRKLRAVAKECIASDTEVWMTGDSEGIAPHLATKINDYLDESHSRTFLVIPLFERPPRDSDQSDQNRRVTKLKKLGALIVEYFDAEVPREQIREDYELVRTQSELALANAETHGAIFMQPVLQKVGWLQQLLFRDHRIKTLLGVLALAGLICFLCLFPSEQRMKIHGVLQPTLRSDIHTFAEGPIEEFFVDHKDIVEKGDPLFRQQSFSISSQILDIESKLSATEQEIRQANIQQGRRDITRDDQVTLSERIRSLESRRVSLQKSLQLLEGKQETLLVTSDIDGTVLTWDARNRLEGKPFGANKYVLTIADYQGDWQLELKIPQGKVGYINEAFHANEGEPLTVDFHLASDPSETFEGKLISISERAEVGQSGNPEFRAIASFDASELKTLKPGVGVTARVHTGKKPIGFNWTYQVQDYIRTWFF